MKKRWIVLGIVVVILKAAVASNYMATHSGPFAYYRLKYPNLSSDEIAEQGNADINRFFAISRRATKLEIMKLDTRKNR